MSRLEAGGRILGIHLGHLEGLLVGGEVVELVGGLSRGLTTTTTVSSGRARRSGGTASSVSDPGPLLVLHRKDQHVFCCLTASY